MLNQKVVLASKIAGGEGYTKHIITGGFTKQDITEAIEDSLQRLQTDYFDLYQLHWSSRGVNCFGVRDYSCRNNLNRVSHITAQNLNPTPNPR